MSSPGPGRGRTVPATATSPAGASNRRSSEPLSSPGSASPGTQVQPAAPRRQSPRRPSGRSASTVHGSPEVSSFGGSAIASVTATPGTLSSRMPTAPESGSPATPVIVTRIRVVDPGRQRHRRLAAVDRGGHGAGVGGHGHAGHLGTDARDR